MIPDYYLYKGLGNNYFILLATHTNGISLNLHDLRYIVEKMDELRYQKNVSCLLHAFIEI